ncbi:hypothetical protein [Helicobacter macacae]|uniref:Uncharacterized protein n=1 Tax=Helicobacter macacae MIT 99-5501 TaxID=1357400 RepID=V8CDC2_9HELI|nr:hypothetical protein [Helicobacter macacae]ETD24726.1 hypothetical protein HMPREF2086_00059 [Helicobacter macacae MIT 99-5501]
MIDSHQIPKTLIDEAFLSSVLERVSPDKRVDTNELKAILLALISVIGKDSTSKNLKNTSNTTKANSKKSSHKDFERIFALFGEIFCAFRERIYAIYERGDILDYTFLYLAFITPDFLMSRFSVADFDSGFEKDFVKHIYEYFPDDERFLHFIEIADEMLATKSDAINTTNTLSATNISQEEWFMLVELGSISRVLAYPSAQYRCINHKNHSKTSKIDDVATQVSLRNGLVFFSAFISLGDMQCAKAQKIQPFIYEAYSLFRLDFTLLCEAMKLAFGRAHSALERRNVCNWQLHIFWNVEHWFNSREWLRLYPLWKKVFYGRISQAQKIMAEAMVEAMTESMTSAVAQNPHEVNLHQNPKTTQNPTNSQNLQNLQPLYQAIDEVLYLQLFLYHFCGNSFISQEQWREFNIEVLEKSSALYREFGAKFLTKSSKIEKRNTAKDSKHQNLQSMKSPQTPQNSQESKSPQPTQQAKKIIGFLRDRFVENSPFKVEYSLIKNLINSSSFSQKYSIKIYCMSLIEKSENDPRIMQLFASLGVEIIDIGLAFNKANFYNSHLQKALALREIIQNDEVEILISPNNGYGISDFLLSVRVAPTQVFWTHGNYVYDIEGIDARLTHICNDLREITHEGVVFGGIPVKMDTAFYNPPVSEQEIKEARENIAYLLAQNKNLEAKDFSNFADEWLRDRVILGVMGRLAKIDSMDYLEVICEILQRREECVFVACGAGNEEVIKSKISQINPSVLSRFCFTGQIDSAVYGHIIDVWLDSFPMEQGESRIEYIAKGKGLALRYYACDEEEFLSEVGGQVDGVEWVVREVLSDLSFGGWGNLSLGSGGNLPAGIHLSGCNLPSGDSFEKSHCPASLDEREMFYLRSQGNEISQSNTANTSIVVGNGGQNLQKNTISCHTEALAEVSQKSKPSEASLESEDSLESKHDTDSLESKNKGYFANTQYDETTCNGQNKESETTNGNKGDGSNTYSPSIAEGVRGWVGSYAKDFTSYKSLVLGFSQTRAFSKEQYLQKALNIIDSTKTKNKNFQNMLRTQSLIFAMGDCIKERLGVKYFMDFVDYV